jgi:mono/diheme cytochrome c family protein
MKNMTSSLGIFALALLAFGCNNGPSGTANSNSQPRSPNTASATASPSVDELAASRERYQKLCSGCHGENGEGGTKTIEGKTLKVPSLKKGHAVEHSDQQLVKQVLNGGDGMPAFKDKVATAEAAEMVRLIRRDFQGK